jgi:hypothetical protein
MPLHYPAYPYPETDRPNRRPPVLFILDTF